MTDSEYVGLKQQMIVLPKLLITIDDLKDKSDRTLIHGYTCDRDTFDIVLSGGQIRKYVTEKMDVAPWYIQREMEIVQNEDYIPNKRVYPDRSDFEFCQLLIHRGYRVPFTTYDQTKGTI